MLGGSVCDLSPSVSKGVFPVPYSSDTAKYCSLISTLKVCDRYLPLDFFFGALIKKNTTTFNIFLSAFQYCPFPS